VRLSVHPPTCAQALKYKEKMQTSFRNATLAGTKVGGGVMNNNMIISISPLYSNVLDYIFVFMIKHKKYGM